MVRAACDICPCKFALIASLVAACGLVLIWPGDAPWVNDEPHLVLTASVLNSTPSSILGIPLPFTLAARGLTGTRGLPYGPLPTWIYQVLLLVSRDPVVLLTVRALLVTSLSAAALYWLSRALRLDPWLAPVAMLSPWLWLYSRQLWDNSFAIPVSALLFAAYADFLQSRRPWSFRLALACCAVLPLVHLMALAMVVPVLLHLAIAETRWCLRFKWSVMVAVLAFIGIPSAYWALLLKAASAIHTAPPLPVMQRLAGAVFPLWGGHHLTGSGLGPFLGDDWITSASFPQKLFLRAAVGFSTIAFAAVWVGMGLAVLRAAKVVRRRGDVAALDQMAAIALAVWLSQTLLDACHGVFDFPHYYNATWIVYAFFAWLAIDAIRKKWLVRALLALQAASLGFVTVYVLLKIHRDGGGGTIAYGATLENQMQVVHEIEGHAPESLLVFDYPGWKMFPDPYRALRELDRPGPGSNLPRKLLIVRLRDAFPTDRRIELEALPPGPLGALEPTTGRHN